MVQILEGNRPKSTSDRFAEAFANLGQSAGQNIPQYLMGKQRNKSISDLLGPGAENLPPEFQEMMYKYAQENQLQSNKQAQQLQSDQNKMSMQEYFKEQQRQKEMQANAEKLRHLESERGLAPGSLDAYLDDPKFAEMVTRAKEDKTMVDDKKSRKRAENALSTIRQMRGIGKKGNLGIFSGVKGIVSADTRKDKEEYERLGRSLISFASPIVIRNKSEFETLAKDLFDSSLTDASREGILKSMEKLIRDELSLYDGDDEEMTAEPKQKRPPLTQFEG